MIAASGIEARGAARATIAGVHVFDNRHFNSANAAEHRLSQPFGAWPHRGGMPGESGVASDAGVIGFAASHSDGDDVGRPVIVPAASF